MVSSEETILHVTKEYEMTELIMKEEPTTQMTVVKQATKAEGPSTEATVNELLKEKVHVESKEEGIGGFGNCNLPNTQPCNVYGMVEENIHVPNTHVEEEQVTNAAEDGDDDESRFAYCDDSDGTDSDDENFSLYRIPPEEEEKPKLPIKKRSLGIYIEEEKEEATYATLEVFSLELAVGQCFETKEDLETRLKILTVLQKFDFDVAKSTPTILILKCWVKEYQWRVRATPVDEYPKFQVRVFVSEHTCSVTDRSSRSRQATHDILGLLYKDYVGRIGPKVLPMHIAEALNKRWQIKMDYWKAYRTLRSARELVRGSPESGYEQLPVYLYMLRRENPGTFMRLEVDETHRFKYLFLAFGASILGFPFMRKVVVVDGTFLQENIYGRFLQQQRKMVIFRYTR
ncbi:Transposase MuDR plant [Arabidopsis suecica]|uniref:Transposase MuDR plant n=1 Tax=Arabidopsis suecica TaxID=45249 RepID=A0A8T2CSV2_ARASU|nr:Transposase MuDR plant [Arabidopsis suecica]